MRILLLVLALLLSPSAPAQRTEARLLLQESLVAGLRHHQAKAVWDHLHVGDELNLVREPHNLHDPNAVRIEWQGHMLGYLPRTDNEAVARQLDRGNKLRARIESIGKYRNHRRRLELAIYLPL